MLFSMLTRFRLSALGSLYFLLLLFQLLFYASSPAILGVFATLVSQEEDP